MDTVSNTNGGGESALQRFSAIQIALHWLTLTVILGLIYTGFTMADMPRGDAKLALIDLHGAFGSLILTLVVLRLVAKARIQDPAEQPMPKFRKRLKPIGHAALYSLLAVQVGTGLGTIFTVGRHLDVFGLFQIASPMQRDIPLHHTIETVHIISFWVLVAFTVLHGVAALWPGEDKKRPLGRMLPF